MFHGNRRIVTALACLFLSAGPASAAEPAAAKLLTPQAIGFVHLRVGDIWKAEGLKAVRETLEHAGPELLTEFNNRFIPSLTDVESVTIIFFDSNMNDLLPTGRPTDRTAVWVITSKKPLDRAALIKSMANSGKARKHGSKEFYFDEMNWSGLMILDDHSYAYTSEDSMVALLDGMAKGGTSPLAAHLASTADKHPATVGIDFAALAKEDVIKVIPQELQPLFKAKTAIFTVDLNPTTTVSATLNYASEAEANDGLKAGQEAVQYVRGQIAQILMKVDKKARPDPARPRTGIHELPDSFGYLFATAALKQADTLLSKMPVAIKGKTVQASLDIDKLIPGGGMTAIMLVVGMEFFFSSAEMRYGGESDGNSYEFIERERNLTELAKAIEKYKKDKGHYPPPAILDKDGKPLLSWRVAILPYMEFAWITNTGRPGDPQINGPKELYDLFKLDEPWDGPNNKKLIDKLPSLYRAPWSVLTYKQSNAGKTTTLAVVGKGAIFDPTKKSVNDADIRDNLKHTLLLLQLEEANHVVYWTKPADIALTGEGKLPTGGPDLAKRFAVVYADGSAHTHKKGLAEKLFMGIVTREGNEKLDDAELRPEPLKPKGEEDHVVPPPPLPPPPPGR